MEAAAVIWAAETIWVHSFECKALQSTYLQVRASMTSSLTDSSQILFVQKGDALYKIKSLLFFHMLRYLTYIYL